MLENSFYVIRTPQNKVHISIGERDLPSVIMPSLMFQRIFQLNSVEFANISIKKKTKIRFEIESRKKPKPEKKPPTPAPIEPTKPMKRKYKKRTQKNDE